MSAARRAIGVVWYREVLRFLRERSRIVGMVAQPLLFLFVIGNGLAASFTPGGRSDYSYVSFMYPGIIAMSIVFTALFAGVSVIWDREFGFLREVLVAPVPRWSVMVGKALGGTTTAVIQGLLILLLAPLLDVQVSVGKFFLTLAVMVLVAFALAAMGLAIAGRMTSTEGFQMIMNFLVMPLFFLSGALFPLNGTAQWLQVLMRLDPLTYGVDALRHALFAGQPEAAALLEFPLGLDLTVIGVMGAVLIGVGAILFSRAE